MEHKWVHWRYLELNGRIRKKGIENPRRERILVRSALSRLGLKYKEIIPILNPEYGGWKGETKGAIQWLDFVVWSGERMFAILFTPNRLTGGAKERDKTAHNEKKAFLDRKGIRYLELRRTETSQIYQILIQNFLKEVR